ncbi:MAG: bifunctional sulfate adenylyltransferase/adenylylsulfate kinase [Anaerolineae bacterium]|nr:bifunctional sulfate adenylyltransferase/adenylylsulfate kinase [Anaerolineae bacterium]
MPHTKLISPYKGTLTNLFVPDEARAEVLEQANHYPSIQISERARHDLELLAAGGFSPLERFMGRADYQRVLDEMRLADGTLFPIPITLTVARDQLPPRAAWLTLRDTRNYILAVMQIEEVFRWDPVEEARHVLGTTDHRHPLVAEMEQWGDLCISGALKVLSLPLSHDFTDLRHTPAETRRRLERLDNAKVVAFQTRNPMHRIHEELTKRAMARIGGSLLIHPVVGLTKPGDVDHYTRVRVYKALVENYFDARTTVLSLLPLAMRLAGPREAVWHAIIRRNYGATHFIVGRDHAGPGRNSQGQPFYGPYDAQNLLATYAGEIGIEPVIFQEIVYLADEDRYEERPNVAEGTRTYQISGTQVRDEYLAKGVQLPSWFTRRETAEILMEAHPPTHKRGICIWFTGLSGAGKSTVANVLATLLLERGRQSTVLDGDVVRTHLSKGLGFSKEDRDTNILRIAFVAGEIVRHHGVAICAAISPYRKTRSEARRLVNGNGRFIEVFVDTPLEVCEQRDVKGLYARARRGEIKAFTGIDDPYEVPISPEIHLETAGHTPEENAREIIAHLERNGFLK